MNCFADAVTFIVLRSESVFPLYFLLGYLHSHVVYLTRTLSRYLIQVTFVVLRIYLTRTLSSILIRGLSLAYEESVRGTAW